ncbi:uncharacterized protein LOC143282324 [Babylonia areolata]|uniref:uncharacterized protein LOC143282324 n=1 Tax=Babylonia areolata TaxID=304850 RepID=UPI003FD3F9C0
MSTSAPFAVSSKCVMRLTSDPDVIIENTPSNVRDDVTVADSNQTDGTPDRPATSSPVSLLSEGRSIQTESGWIFRSDENHLLFPHQQKRHCRETSGAADNDTFRETPADRQPDAAPAILSPEDPTTPSVRMSVELLPLCNLPHPSKLRKKAGPGAKRQRDHDTEHPVEKHIQQLKKKKVAYFYTAETAVQKACSQAETKAATSMNEETSPQTGHAHISPVTPTEADGSADVRKQYDMAVVPSTAVPVTEDEDDHWFKSHWQSPLSWPLRCLEE